jgi:hypothetical protein
MESFTVWVCCSSYPCIVHLLPCLKSLLLPPFPPLHAGHSLGGALAVLASLEIARQHPDSHITTYTFGCPRVGRVAGSPGLLAGWYACGRLRCVAGWEAAAFRAAAARHRLLLACSAAAAPVLSANQGLCMLCLMCTAGGQHRLCRRV